MSGPAPRRPGAAVRWIVGPLVAALIRGGLGPRDARVLEVRGRRTGRRRSVPVNLLVVGEDWYLVAPRGATQWVRNLRVAGEGRLVAGRRDEPIVAVEVAPAAKPPILRAYLERWGRSAAPFTGGAGPGATDEELRELGERVPVFRLGSAPG